MKKNNVVEINKPEEIFDDPLTELIRNGAKKILKEALEAEIETFVEKFSSLKTKDGSRRVVRNGYLPERTIVTGVGSHRQNQKKRPEGNEDQTREKRVKRRYPKH